MEVSGARWGSPSSKRLGGRSARSLVGSTPIRLCLLSCQGTVVRVILPIGFGDFQNLCFPFGPPNLCFPSLYRKNVFYYCATFIRGHIRYQKEGILCALSIFSGDLL